MSRSALGTSLSETIKSIKAAVSQVPSIGELQELDIQPRLCGIYFLLLRGEVIYIGRGTTGVTRSSEWVRQNSWFTSWGRQRTD